MTELNVTTYIVRNWSEGAKANLPSTRLAVIRWKATKNADGSTKDARKPVCVEVPVVPITVTPAIIQDALRAAFLDLQDEFIRTRVEADYAALRENVFFTHTDFELSTLQAYLTEKAASGKLSGDTIKAWFTANLRDTLEEKFAAIPDISDAKVAAAVKEYGETFAKLASPAWSPATKLAQQLLDATMQAKADPVTTKLTTRLQGILKPKTESLLLNL